MSVSDLCDKRDRLKSGARRATQSETDFSRTERGNRPGGSKIFGAEFFPPNPLLPFMRALVLPLE